MNCSILPENLDSIQKSECFPVQRHRWSTNEEIAALLIAIDKHEEWLSKEVKIRPKSGSMMLYSRKRVRYRRDGYCWKKRKDGKTTREDHMKLKVQGTECIYGCYVHSAILPTFHRRCYWLLQNPDIVLVHYLNVPYSDDNKVISPALNYFADNKKEWTKDELISELKPMFFSENEPDLNNDLEKSTVETIEAIVGQLMVKQRAKVKALEDASDGGINAKALTVVNAITNSTREAVNKQNANKSNTSSVANNKCKPTSNQTLVNKRELHLGLMSNAAQNSHSKLDNNPSKQLSSQGTVQLLQLANSGQTAIRTTNANTSQSSQSAPTSLIFNLSQFQSGSGLLILNSPTTAHQQNHRHPNESSAQQLTAPLTLLHYGRAQTTTTGNNGVESTSIPNVICSTNKSLNSMSSTAQHQKLNTTTDLTIEPTTGQQLQQQQQQHSTGQQQHHHQNNFEARLNQLNSINLLNSHQNINNIQIKKEFEINGNFINSSGVSSDSENSDEITNGNNRNCVENSGHNYSEESMIVNSNPSTPEHMKSSVGGTGLTNILNGCGGGEHTRNGVDLNSNHSQPQQLTLTHNHNYNYNQYFNNNNNNLNNNNNNNNTNINNRQQQNNVSQQQSNTGLMSYELDANDLNPMDFIDNDIPTPDETLFNLDTFDILGDIDNLDDLSQSNASNNYRNLNLNQIKTIKSESSSATISSAQDYREMTANITDYSPEWCYPEGGIKVLVAGPFFTSAYRYTILFDGVSVTTHLVQNGLLRCYSPEHEPGFVTLQVACDGIVISNSVIFEYRDHPTVPVQKTEDYFSVDENIFKFSLLERFELLESRLSQCSSKRGLTGMESTKHFTNFEDRLVQMCTDMSGCSWLPYDESSLTTQSLRSGLSNKDMSLIHLAAALNYYKLIQCLLKWRKENPSLILELEIDAFSCDDNECTPLMWSCAKGHYESTLLVYRWNRAAINLCNKTGDSPLQLARRRGHQRLVDEIERLEKQQSTTICAHNSYDSQTSDNVSGFVNGFRKPRKASLDITSVANKQSTNKTVSPSTVKRGSACLQHGLSAFPKLVKCFSADSSLTNAVNDQLNGDSTFLSSYISDDSEDELEMSTSGSTNGLSSSHRDSIGSCDIIIDCNGSESSRVLTLAEHIIAAMPDRIKAASIASLPDEDFDDDDYEDNEISGEDLNELPECESHPNNRSHSQMGDTFCNFSFEITDNYNYRETNTPSNSSPASSSCLHSPSSFPLDSPSPPPTAADFCEFFQASGKITKELGDLTLTDKEQRELYEAAKVIQKAYRSYKGRKRLEEQSKGCGDKDKERVAAILIQSYYRRYKQYIYYKQMTKAAQVIQNQYRNYCEHKRFKKSFNDKSIYSVVNATDGSGCVNQSVVNNFICNYSDCDQIQCKNSREGTPFSGLKRTYSQRRRNQAARKIQQFMRQSKNKLQRERALAAEEGSLTQEVLSIRAQTQQSID